MTIQGWVASKLSEHQDFEVEFVGDHGLSVSHKKKERLVVVAEPSNAVFSQDDLAETLKKYPNCEAVILIRRFPDAGVVEAARARGVLIDSLGNVTRGLESRGPLRDFQNRDEEYLRSRIGNHNKVSGMTRVGLKAWRIERHGLPDLLILTHDRYEFPVDSLYQLLSEHPGLEPDAFVITNPNTNGLSKRVTDAAAQTGIEIYLLKDVFARLARE